MGGVAGAKLLAVKTDNLEQASLLDHNGCKGAIEARVAVTQSLFDRVMAVILIARRRMHFCGNYHVLCVGIG
ncbi:hypothetical protein [uncultured Maritimibacter sp.]|jgi:hypothetical protein|uniref:hypothetical protein n=1 Tax=uncultured Maritimibacter sp. TaxID=991866 RepID=UPI00261A83D8|nr:hypothetical protein [uncultured Maritimibacter sp.]